MTNLIYDRIYPVSPQYLVKVNDDYFRLDASESQIDVEHGIVFFSKNKSVVAMFRLEDVKSYWRII